MRAQTETPLVPTRDPRFDPLLVSWLNSHDGQARGAAVTEVERLAHPYERAGVRDSLADVFLAESFAVGSGDLFETAAVVVSIEASERGSVAAGAAGAAGLCTLASLFALAKPGHGSGPYFVHPALTVAFRLVANGNDWERRWVLACLDAVGGCLADGSKPTSEQWTGEAALVGLGRAAVHEVITGRVDEATVERVAEHLDRDQPPGYAIFVKHPRRANRDLAAFLDALAQMLGDSWHTSLWQTVRHVLTEPRQ